MSFVSANTPYFVLVLVKKYFFHPCNVQTFFFCSLSSVSITKTHPWQTELHLTLPHEISNATWNLSWCNDVAQIRAPSFPFLSPSTLLAAATPPYSTLFSSQTPHLKPPPLWHTTTCPLPWTLLRPLESMEGFVFLSSSIGSSSPKEILAQSAAK